MQQLDIIITGLQDFNSEIGSNAVNLAYEFAKKHKVLYVNYPLDRLTALRHKHTPAVARRLDIIKKGKSNLEQLDRNLWVLTPSVILESISKIPFTWLFDKFLYINNKRYAREIIQAKKALNMNNVVLFEDSDLYRTLHFKELLQPDIFIYYSRDNIIETPYFRKHGFRVEREMMRKADAVVCNSAYLAHLARRYNDNSYDVGQGVDTDLFREKPDELPKILQSPNKPVIGYVGALNSLRLDVELMEEVATKSPQWLFVLVGPEDDAFRQSKLHQLDNVVFTGKAPYKKLPGYVHGFDVAINPQVVNNVTIGNYPRKIDEYLAAGKPVVATKTEAMKMFYEVVYLATDTNSFIKMLEKALDEKDKDKHQRIELAVSHTWQHSAERIYTVIENIKEQRQHGTNR